MKQLAFSLRLLRKNNPEPAVDFFGLLVSDRILVRLGGNAEHSVTLTVTNYLTPQFSQSINHPLSSTFRPKRIPGGQSAVRHKACCTATNKEPPKGSSFVCSPWVSSGRLQKLNYEKCSQEGTGFAFLVIIELEEGLHTTSSISAKDQRGFLCIASTLRAF